MNLLVTGATGFLGEHLCRVLVERGHTVRGLARSRSGVLADLGVEMIRGDVLSGDELDAALQGTHAVFHLAGAVSRDPDDAQRMMRLHVDGTRRTLEKMKQHGVTRMVLASTSGVLGVSKDEEILDETAPYAEEIVAGWPYYASKIYQERLAFEHGAKHGIDVIAINPTLLLGPGDRRLSSTEDVRKFIKGQIPVVPGGGISFVDARDVAEATANALEMGKPGERYLMGASNWTMKEFFARLGRIANVAPAAAEAAREAQQVGRDARRGALPASRQGAADRSDQRRDGGVLLVDRFIEGGARARLRGARPAAHARRYRRVPAPGRGLAQRQYGGAVVPTARHPRDGVAGILHGADLRLRGR